MSNTSATGGFLAPIGTQPIDDDALDDFLQEIVVGITGMPGENVRPRWQTEPPNIPPPGVDWAAIGVVDFDRDTFAYVAHGADIDTLHRHEVMQVVASFYGPNASGNAKILDDGLQISQNREVFLLNGYGLVACGSVTNTTALVQNLYLRRFDLIVFIKRHISRDYPVLDLLSASIDIHTDHNDVSSVTSVTFDSTSITWDMI